MIQLGLFDALRAPPIILPVDPDGLLIQGEVDERLCLRHPRLAWDRAEIEIHRHDDGLWMWSASWHCEMCGSGYRVGPKWGKFAESRDDALFYAISEIREGLSELHSRDADAIRQWLERLGAAL